MLDSLVERGILTPSEASQIAKESAAPIILRPTTKSLKLGAKFQFQGEFLESEALSGTSAGAYASKTGFVFRRIIVDADAGVGGGWGAHFAVDFSRNQLSSLLLDNYAYKKIDGEYLNGKLQLGYKRAGFCFEEMTPMFSLRTIEISAASQYWAYSANGRRLGIGSRYAGAMWNGKVNQIEGLTYNLSITNSFQLSPCETPGLEYNFRHNSPAYWFGAKYERKFGGVKLAVGGYSMYSDSANQNMGLSNSTPVYSLNPYLAGEWEGLYFFGELLSSGVSAGRKAGGSVTQANPYGITCLAEYRVDIGDYGKIAPVFRYCWLDTGGRGVRMGDIQRHATNVGALYNNAQDFYAGLNWYIRGDDLKFMIGYSYISLSGAAENRHSADVGEASAVRMQFQIRL